MADMRHLMNGVPPGMVPMQVQRPPTETELEEVRTVRSMQARDRAVALAVEHARGESITTVGLLELARHIARYIETGETGP